MSDRRTQSRRTDDVGFGSHGFSSSETGETGDISKSAQGLSGPSPTSAVSTGRHSEDTSNSTEVAGVTATRLPSIPHSDYDTDQRMETASSSVSDVRWEKHRGPSFSYARPRRRSFSYLSDYHPRASGKEPAVNGRGYMTSATFMKAVVVFFGAFYLWDTWRPVTSADGQPCAHHDRGLCGTRAAGKVFLAISRTTAGALVPSMVFCIMAKFYATRYFLHHSWLSYIVSVEPAHEVHTYFGNAVVFFSVAHVFTHVARLIYIDSFFRIWDASRDRAGIVAFVALLATTVPMIWRYLKIKFTFELRKAVHMLSVVFVVAMCFHTPYMGYLCGVLFAWYVFDRLYFTTRMTFKIEHPILTPVGRGTFVRFDLPDGYDFKVGSYVQLNCPAISTTEWHPFSIFPVPGPTPQGGFHIEAVGDWTRELFRLSLERPRMPLWITAAQPSIMEESIYFDNRTGITPAICVAEMYEKKKNIHLIWMSRDASMIAMFEEQLRHMKSTVHLTGKSDDETRNSLTNLLAPIGDKDVARASKGELRPTQASWGLKDLTSLEAGADTDGEDTVERDDKRQDMSAGRMVSGSMQPRSSRGKSPHKGQAQINPKVSPGTHPVTVEFGRPDMHKFINATINSTNSPDVSRTDPKHASTPRARFFHAATDRARLSPTQHASKTILTSADVTAAVEDKKRVPKSGAVGPRGPPPAETGRGSTQKWLVLYCGGNAFIEKAVAEACGELKVPWKREYFSAW